MSSYQETLKASMERLDDDELRQKIKNKHYTEEAEVIARNILEERGSLHAQDVERAETEDAVKDESNTYLTLEQQNAFNRKNALIWLIALYMFGASQHARIESFIVGIIWGLVGVAIYFIVTKVRKVRYTHLQFRKKYGSNYKGLLFALGLSIFFVIMKVVYVPTMVVFVDLVVLLVGMLLLITRIKFAKQLIAAYSVIPVAISIFTGGGGNMTIMAFVFYCSAQSLIMEEVLNAEIE